MLTGFRRLNWAHAVDAAFGVRECSVLLQEGSTWEEDVRKCRSFVEEEILHDDALHRTQRGFHVLGVGI